jgi:PAS domain S-box-containing protein
VAAIAHGLQRLVPFTRMSVALYDEVAGHFNVYQAEVTGISAPEVVRDVPLDVSGTVTWEVYREANARFFRLEHQADAREQFSDLRAWYDAGERSTLLVPMISGVQAIGVLRLGTELENAFGFEENRDLIQRLANLSAVSLENVQLFARAQERAAALDAQAQRMALLNRVALALAQTLDLENIFEIALREAAISLGITEGAAMQIDPERNLAHMVVEYPRGDAPPELALDVTGNAALRLIQDELVPIVIEQTPGDPLYEALRAWLRREDVYRSLLVPLVAGGQVIGVLCLNALSPERFFTDEQIELAQTIGSQAAIAVQNAALFEQTAQRTRELETLFESAQATAVTLDLNEVARRVTVQMVAALSADACTVFLWDEVNDTLIVRGEVSARSGSTASEQVGDVYSLAPYPLRSKALRERTLLVVRADDPDLPPGERDLMLRHAAASRVLIPLVVNDVAIGLVEVELLDPERRILPGMLRLAQALGSQAAISIENARLQTETRRTVEELYVINDISSGLSAANTLEELLQVIDTLLPSLTDADALYVALYEPLSQQITFPLATNVLDDEPLNEPPRPLGRDEFSVVIEQRAPLLLAGQDLFDLRDRLQIDTIMPEARCFLGVPLFAADEVIGVLAVRNDRNPLAFSSSDQRILTTVGAQLGIAIQSMRLFQQTLQLAEELEQRVRERTAELEQERQHIATLYGISTELASSLDMERLLSRALELVAHAVGATHGAILQLDREAERLVFRAYYGWPEGTPTGNGAEPPTLTLEEGLAGWAVRNRRSLVIDDVRQDPRWLRLGEADDIPRSAMAVLIETSEDVLGVAMLYSDRVGAFTEDHLRLVTAAAHQVANAMNNAELYGLIRDQAERLGVLLRQEQIEATKSAAILDSVADGVLVANEYGEIIVFNQTASRILGLPVESVLGRTMADIAGLYGPGRPRLVSAVQRWMRDPLSYEPGEFIEERLELENKRVISVRVSPVYLDEQFLGTVSVFRDITREVEVDRLKSEFVATVSHELRTPMTSIKGYADLLLLGAAGEVQPQQRSFLETIKNNADRLSILVNDLLDISRIDQGRVELRFGPVDVAAVIEQIAAHLYGRCEDERRAMQVIVHPPDDPTLTVWGDYDKVAQILTNLADNAFNYTPEGGTITLSAERDPAGGDVIFAVSDTGIGIPPEIAPRVFERFFRGDEFNELVMDTPGTGLGLAIVRELVQFHRGEVWFDSEVGKGTTFYVRLPVRAPEMQTMDTAAHAEGE